MIGTTINHRYQIESKLGQGGMGTVYRAHDTILERDVAIKVLTNTGLGTEGRARLLNEARTIARLNHPNIVMVFDTGEIEADLFIVMELVAGSSIYEHKPTDLVDIITIARQLCGALEHAHANGIIHRDLKPENVIITPHETVKLMDFGLARSVASRLTADGTIIGTVFYMAPEQALGGKIDHRSDLYALGVMLYELSTGGLPFVADDPVAVISQHIHAPVVPPRARNDQISPALEALILQLMSKDPDERPSSARDVLERLADPEMLDTHALPAEERSLLDRIVRGHMVGREQELQQARLIWGKAASGAGQLLLLSGEPGVGKTRLMREIVTQVEVSGGQAFIGENQAEGNAPYAAVAQIIRRALRVYQHDGLETPRLVMAELIAIAPELQVDYPEVPPNPPLEPESERRRLFESVIRFITNLSEKKPLLLVLEDIHWADSGTLALLQLLAQRTREIPVLLLGTYREVELDQALPFHETLLDLNRRNLGTRLKLERLDQPKTREMLAVLFSEEITPEFLAGIYKETEGNPFFIEEVCKALVENGALYFADGEWHRPDMAEMTIPQSIKVAVQSRLRKLSEAAQDILLNAAVIGREFDYEILRQVTGKEENTLIDGLEAALKTQLIEELKEGDGENFRFSHALIPAALRESISGLRRTRLHRKVAQVIEAFQPEAYQRLAYQWGEAGDADKGLVYTIKAADLARQTYANEDAIRLYTEALTLLPEDHPKRFDLLAARAVVYDMTTQREAQLADIEAMLALAESQKDQTQQVDALLALTNLYMITNYPKAWEPVERALEIAQRSGDLAREARAHYILGLQHRHVLEFDLARQHFEYAITIARASGLNCDLAEYLSHSVIVYEVIGDHNAVFATSQEAMALSKEIDDKRLVNTIRQRLGYACCVLENYDEGFGILEETLLMAGEIGDTDAELRSMNNLGRQKQKIKLFSESEAYFLKMLQVPDIFSHFSTAYAVGNIGILYLEMGEYEKYLRLIGDMLEKARQVENEYWISHLKDDLTIPCFWLGKFVDCLEISESIWPYFEKSLDQGAQAAQFSVLGIYAAAAGNFELAYQYLEAARDRCDTQESLNQKVFVLIYSAHVALLNGKSDAIRTGLKQSNQGIEISRNLQSRSDWQNLYILASLHMASLEENPFHALEALTYLEEAIRLFEEELDITLLLPEQLFFLASRVLRANDRLEEADDYLRRAYERVILVAGKIKDDDLRQSYLENVSDNRKILAEARAMGWLTNRESGNTSVP